MLSRRPRGLVLAYLVAVGCTFVGLGLALRMAPEPAARLFDALTLDPAALLSRPWTALTYAFFHAPDRPFELVFALIALWVFGPELEERWSRARLAGLAAATALAGALAAWVAGVAGLAGRAAGVPAIGSAVLVAWCVGNRGRPLQLWMVPVTGAQLLAVAVALQLFGVVTGPSPTGAAELAALLTGAAFADDTPLRRAWLERRLRRVQARRAALRVLPGGRAKPPPKHTLN